MHIIVILALGIVAWAAVEWMFFKEVARTWRDSKLERSAKICAVVMACIDIPLAWLSPYAAILLVAWCRPPNGTSCRREIAGRCRMNRLVAS